MHFNDILKVILELQGSCKDNKELFLSHIQFFLMLTYCSTMMHLLKLSNQHLCAIIN